MEMRERALYRHLEKGALQIAAIEQRIGTDRGPPVETLRPLRFQS
jgi:hypothetical protein